MDSTPRKIDTIIIHCSDSDRGQDDHVEVIKEWHLARGFNDIGYHYVITKNGKIWTGRLETQVGAHVEGHNANSIGICLTGKHLFTEEQHTYLVDLVKNISTRYEIPLDNIRPHRHYNSNKTCPNFDVFTKVIQYLYKGVRYGSI